jgi:hypothetical protein
MIRARRILLVEPEFPIPAKSKNHKNFLPIGLLKIASWLTQEGVKIRLIRGVSLNEDQLREIKRFKPDEVWITSLFTYWAVYVREAVDYYKTLLPSAKIVVGGVYASLLSKKEVKQFTGCDSVHQGIIPAAERCIPAYNLIENSNSHPLDYQIIHASRGCQRKCKFCGTWKVEPQLISKSSIADEIVFKKIVFYDNNFLMNPYVEDILNELIVLRKSKKIDWVESQSGFDGRELINRPFLANLIKRAGFRYPRIAWDSHFKHAEYIQDQIEVLLQAGYSHKDIYVFMLFNWDIPFEEMERKRIKCWEMKVQIADCRFRPLYQLFDYYNPHRRNQTSEDYYIHIKAGWNDPLIKQFRKNIREQNIAIRQDSPFYSRAFERKNYDEETVHGVWITKDLQEKLERLKKIGADYWRPSKIRFPSNCKTNSEAGAVTVIEPIQISVL